jgi:dipeptidyl aminopeptidase/acylaminoacyl peptidase
MEETVNTRRWIFRFRLLLAVGALAVGLMGQFLPVPGNLKAEGIPAIPEELATELQRYTEFRTASFSGWHPVRREMLISTRFGNVPQLHRVAAPGAARTQLTFFAEPVSSGDYQPQSGRYIAFTRDVGGSEFYQIFLYDTHTGRSRMVSDGKSRNQSLRWSPSGKQLAFTSTRRTGRDFDIYVMDPEKPESARMVFPASRGRSFSVADWSPDEKALLILSYGSITDAELIYLRLADGVSRQLTPAKDGEQRAVDAARFTRDGRWILYTSDQGGEFKTLRRQPVAGGAEETLVASPEGDVEAFALSADEKHLAYTLNLAGESRLHLVEFGTRTALPVPAIPKGTISGLEWREGAAELGFTSNNSQGANAYSLEVSGALTQWTFSELGGLLPEELRDPEIVRWKSFDGLEISGLLYLPPAKFQGKRPVIIQIHGGPEGQSRPGFQGSRNYFLSELGVAVLYPNVRGSAGFGKTFVSLDNGRKREDSVKDIGSLLDYIATRPDLDADRVMVSGGSYGGYMVLAAMTHYNARIRAAVDVVGISNWVTFLNNTQGYRQDLRRAEYGDERDPDMREFLERISPLTNAARITKPMLVIQGKNDPRVPVTESLQMVEKIRSHGGTIWYLEAADEGHGFRKKGNRDFQLAAEALFVRENLLR